MRVMRGQDQRRGGRRRCRRPPEESAYVLDLCPPNPEDKHREHREREFLQLVGEKYFTLMEALPRSPGSVEVGSRIELVGPLSVIRECSVYIIEYEDLSPYARTKLEEVIPEILKRNEDVFVEFFNTAGPINIRFHTLELLPGIGKKTLMKILEARSREPFKSFEDIKERVKIDPVKALTERILKELRGEDRYYLFVRPPPWVLRRRRDIVVFDILSKLYAKRRKGVEGGEAALRGEEGATSVDEEAAGASGGATQ